MNLSQAENIAAYIDFTRVESIEVLSFTRGACDKVRQNVVMIMFSGKKHTWGEYVDNKKAAKTMRDKLLVAVEKAYIEAGYV